MWKVYLYRLACRWFGKPRRKKKKYPSAGPVYRYTLLSLEGLEARELLSPAVPPIRAELSSPLPGMLQGLGTPTAGTETGFYDHDLVETGAYGGQRYELDAGAHSEFTIAVSGGTPSRTEVITLSYTLKEAFSSGDPLGVVSTGRTTLTQGPSSNLALYALQGFNTEIPGYAPEDLGLNSLDYSQFSRHETLDLESSATNRSGSFSGGNSSDSFSISWSGTLAASAQLNQIASEGDIPVQTTQSGSGTLTGSFTSSGSLFPSSAAGVSSGYTLASTQSGTFSNQSTGNAVYNSCRVQQ